MRIREPLLMFGLVLFAVTGADSQTAAESHSRIGVSAGMGVSYVDPFDVVDLVNSTPGAVERVPQFKAGVEFFGTANVPVSPEWSLKFEYAYFLASYNTGTVLGPAEYTLMYHLPSVIIQYLLLDAGVYNVRVGAGVGYHVGILERKFFTEDDQYTGSGIGSVADLEANTAFGEHLYAYLGANLRWEFVGDLKNNGGLAPGVTPAGGRPTLHLFGVGARLGFTYYF